MTKEEAIQKAMNYVGNLGVDVGPVLDAKYHDCCRLEALEKDCPPDLVETYHSVKKSFRNQWVVTFKVKDVPGQISCPQTRLVSVFESGEATLFS